MTVRVPALALVCGVLAALGLVLWDRGVRDPADAAAPVKTAPVGTELLTRGGYLARAGNCMFCHTGQGGRAYAGGRVIETPFGSVVTSNLTPDAATGIGAWTATDFWRALHHGRSRDGRLLVPAFPYTGTTELTREDTDALFAYLRSIEPVVQANPPHELRWPYNTQLALAAWRALYFTPGVFQVDPGKSAEWNRGAYLVRALGHCGACHGQRNAMGAVDDARGLAGGLVATQNWYAPSLLLAREAGVAHWDAQDIVALLQTGISPRGSVSGPMAEVVLHSTQYLSVADLLAIATYLQSLPQASAETAAWGAPQVAVGGNPLGAKLYEKHCAQCHGENGEGVRGAYPALAGNRAVLMPNATNLVQIVLRGGFAPATLGNPRPFGMPPYEVLLGEADIAAVLTHIRSAWGNQAPQVTERDVARYRAGTMR